MGGAVEKGNLANFSWELSVSELKLQRRSNVLPLGILTVGIFYHRALLFKVCSPAVYTHVVQMFYLNALFHTGQTALNNTSWEQRMILKAS